MTSSVVINDDQLNSSLEDWGRKAVGIFAREAAQRAAAITGVLSTNAPSTKEWGYSLPPGLLRGSIYGDDDVDSIGPVGRIHYATPLGYFRNLSGHGTAAYGHAGGPSPTYFATRRGGRRVRQRRPRAALRLYGRARGDWRSIGRALDSLDGATVTSEGVFF